MSEVSILQLVCIFLFTVIYQIFPMTWGSGFLAGIFIGGSWWVFVGKELYKEYE